MVQTTHTGSEHSQLSLASDNQESLQTSNETSTAFTNVISQMNIASSAEFQTQLEQLWQQASEEQSLLSLLVCDIDFFDEYLENYGEQSTSFMLLVVALALKSVCEKQDLYLAHYQKHEFAILSKGGEEVAIEQLADTLRKEVAKTKHAHSYSAISDVVTLSVGVSNIYPSSVNLFKQQAERSLVTAKRSVLAEAKAQTPEQASAIENEQAPQVEVTPEQAQQVDAEPVVEETVVEEAVTEEAAVEEFTIDEPAAVEALDTDQVVEEPKKKGRFSVFKKLVGKGKEKKSHIEADEKLSELGSIEQDSTELDSAKTVQAQDLELEEVSSEDNLTQAEPESVQVETEHNNQETSDSQSAIEKHIATLKAANIELPSSFVEDQTPRSQVVDFAALSAEPVVDPVVDEKPQEPQSELQDSEELTLSLDNATLEDNKAEETVNLESAKNTEAPTATKEEQTLSPIEQHIATLKAANIELPASLQAAADSLEKEKTISSEVVSASTETVTLNIQEEQQSELEIADKALTEKVLAQADNKESIEAVTEELELLAQSDNEETTEDVAEELTLSSATEVEQSEPLESEQEQANSETAPLSAIEQHIATLKAANIKLPDMFAEQETAELEPEVEEQTEQLAEPITNELEFEADTSSLESEEEKAQPLSAIEQHIAAMKAAKEQKAESEQSLSLSEQDSPLEADLNDPAPLELETQSEEIELATELETSETEPAQDVKVNEQPQSAIAKHIAAMQAAKQSKLQNQDNSEPKKSLTAEAIEADNEALELEESAFEGPSSFDTSSADLVEQSTQQESNLSLESAPENSNEPALETSQETLAEASEQSTSATKEDKIEEPVEEPKEQLDNQEASSETVQTDENEQAEASEKVDHKRPMSAIEKHIAALNAAKGIPSFTSESAGGDLTAGQDSETQQEKGPQLKVVAGQAVTEQADQKMLQQLAGMNFSDKTSLDKKSAALWKVCLIEDELISLVMADVDFFQEYVDRFGQEKADQSLMRIATSINKACTAPGTFCFYFGQGKFGVLIKGMTGTQSLRLAEKIRKQVEGLGITAANTSVSKMLTMSIGLSCLVVSESTSTGQLKEDAKDALHMAVLSGRNQTCL